MGVIERAPAAQKYAPLTHFLVPRQSLVKEVEEIVMNSTYFMSRTR
jgi:hypothetical protein